VGTGVIARIELGKSKTIAFRSDMDALPISENADKLYKSTHQGFMHACGHDGHMALLLAFARYCMFNKDKLACNPVFIFQPAEEGKGGAINMIENGALDGVDEIYAVHLDTSLPEGLGGIGEGVSMAGAYEFDIAAYGRSSHCAKKQIGIDALHAVIDVITKTYNDFPENIKDSTIFHCGKITGGVARNVVADYAEAHCTIRYFEGNDLKAMLDLMSENIKAAENERGARFEIKMHCNYIPLENDPRCAAKAAKYIKSVGLEPRFEAEDFSFYLKEKPGCLVWVGVGEDVKLHNPDFDFDEKVLLKGLRLYISLAEEK
jgi:hippurate hydrolase